MKQEFMIFCFGILALMSCLLLAAAIALHSSQIDFPKLSGPFLGQKPPGMTPEVFAPGIVSKEGHQAKLFFISDGSEAIYDERNPVSNKNHFVWLRSTRGVWSKPVVILFSTEYINNEPCLSPDGKKLFFVSNRPAVPGGEAERTPDIWMSERTEDVWGEPLRLGPAVNTPEVEVQPYFSTDGKLYFMRQSGGGRQLLCASFQDGKFLEPISLGGNIPPDQVSGPCISPDNRVLILHSRMEGGFGNWDLYASFKDASGNWGKLVNLGKTINTEGSEGNATFSQDGKFLFFSRNGDIFRVSSKIIEELRLKSDFPKLTGPYLGQKLPGKTPEPFALDIVELQNLHGMIGFSPDGKEAYWKPVWRALEPILVSRMENGRWTVPTAAAFSAANQGDDSPFISPDGRKIYFISQRPPAGGEQAPRKERIWATERIPEGWSEPRPLPDVINSMNGIHWQFSVDYEGNLYFGARGGHEGEIYCAKYQDGQYRLPEKLGPEINAAGIYNYAPYIHPDGRLLLFSRSRAKDPAKIFVSVKQKDGTWTEAKMLFENAARPVLTPDGKYLFFARGDGITCWVEAGFIDELRPKS